MAKLLEDIVDEGLACLVPEYLKAVGNVTRVVSIKGEDIVEKKSVKSILRRLARIYAVDIISLRSKYGKIIGQKNIVPLPFSSELILVPFKTRTPMAPWDGTIGYISYSQIEKIKEDSEDGVIIALKCGLSIKALCRKATAEKHLRDAGVVCRAYMDMYRRHEQQSIVIRDIYEAYSQPATKGDIALLTRELMELKERLK